jgi:hypothetical protein
MNHFMVEVTLPSYLSQEFMELIPEQRRYVDEMFERGVISSYTLALDRSRAWVTFFADSPKEVHTFVRNFPIAEFIEYTIHELAFFNAASVIVPSISLN